MNTFSITVHLSYQDFRNLNYKLTYRKKWIVVISALAVISILASLIAYFTHNDSFFDSWFFSLSVGAIWMAVVLPIAILLGVRSRYKSNKGLQSPMVFEFSEEGVSVTSELYFLKFKWQNLHKIEFVDNWLLLYQSNATAHFVKLDDSNQENIIELKKFLNIEEPKAKAYSAKPL